MKLYTPVSFPEFDFELSLTSKSLFLGSCFAEEIGNRLGNGFLDIAVNPCGITYNPESISRLIGRALDQNYFTEEELIQNNESYVHLDLHSSFNQSDPKVFIDRANAALEELLRFLKQANCIFITLGTSIVYEIESNRLVNNCHKLPSNQFRKRTLDLSGLEMNFAETIVSLKSVNQDLQVVLTVSPIRHLRHGAKESMQSKARLILMCEMVEERFEFVSYLPVYEFVMDELRDYRFYNQKDLIHLNDLGVDMVFEKFSNTVFSAELKKFYEETAKWKSMLNHRISNPYSEESKKLFEKIRSKGKNLIENSPEKISKMIQARLQRWEESRA